MKNTLLFIFALTCFTGAFAQNRGGGAAPVPPPLPLREVSGIVKDTTDNTIIGATVMLVSKKDTLRTTTNADGVFIFKNVKLATFVLTVTEIGFNTSVRKYLQNDAVKHVILDPIILKNPSINLHEIKINGTPSITYKTDTVEYRASDYKVRENATVDELLKKMEGMEVGTDGSLTHQGQSVTKARLNGKDYSGGNVAQAIQNLPADIVEKIQIVDDYGDEAARTGVKSGDPTKTLNITTRADRSVGNIARATAGVGNDDRYNGNLFLQRLNANQQIEFIGNLQNTVNGVASTGVSAMGAATTGGGGGGGGGNRGGSSGGNGNGSSSGSGGTTNSGSPTISYRDQWGKKIQVDASYGYSFKDVNSINSSYGDDRTYPAPVQFTNESKGVNNTKSHNFSFEFEDSIDSANFLRVTPNFSYTNTFSNTNATYSQTGYNNYNKLSNSFNSSTVPSFGGLIFYQHIFKKPRRNFSIQLNGTDGSQQQDNGTGSSTAFFDSNGNPTATYPLNTEIKRPTVNTTYRTSLTYVEPINNVSQIEFNGQVNYRGYDTKAINYNVNSDNSLTELPLRSNVYNYSFTETRLALNYRFQGTKVNWSIGVTGVPSVLDGTNVTKNNYHTESSDFKLIPIARFQYAMSRTQRFSVNYSGSNTEPTFTQIQPFADSTNSPNITVGNPDLKPAFRHSVNLQYNNYIANSKLNFSAFVNSSIYENQVATNVLLKTFVVPGLPGQPNTVQTANETHYVNLNGAYSISGNYNISKQLADRKYNLGLNGTVGFNHGVSMTRNNEYYSTTWRWNERFGPRINPTDWFEINPYVSYDISRSFFTNPGSVSTDVETTALAVDGRVYFLKTFNVGYSASKNYVSGISSNVSSNPFVANLFLEKTFFQKKNMTLRIDAFDLFNQNNFVNQVVSDYTTTYTRTNALSRYVLFSLRVNLQKWSGTPQRNGRDMQRRGDGSFIY